MDLILCLSDLNLMFDVQLCKVEVTMKAAESQGSRDLVLEDSGNVLVATCWSVVILSIVGHCASRLASNLETNQAMTGFILEGRPCYRTLNYRNMKRTSEKACSQIRLFICSMRGPLCFYSRVHFCLCVIIAYHVPKTAVVRSVSIKNAKDSLNSEIVGWRWICVCSSDRFCGFCAVHLEM